MPMKNNMSLRIRPRVKLIKGVPELLPFVSIFFLLTVFFMMGSSFVPVSGIPVNLPTAKIVGTYGVKKYIVTIDRNGNIYFNDTIIENLNQLKSKLLTDVAALGENAAIVIRADMNTQYGTFAQIMSLADELKINVFLLARPADTGRQTNFLDN